MADMGDMQGKPTTNHGTTVDYVIGTPLLLNTTMKFEVIQCFLISTVESRCVFMVISKI